MGRKKKWTAEPPAAGAEHTHKWAHPQFGPCGVALYSCAYPGCAEKTYRATSSDEFYRRRAVQLNSQNGYLNEESSLLVEIKEEKEMGILNLLHRSMTEAAPGVAAASAQTEDIGAEVEETTVEKPPRSVSEPQSPISGWEKWDYQQWLKFIPEMMEKFPASRKKFLCRASRHYNIPVKTLKARYLHYLRSLKIAAGELPRKAGGRCKKQRIVIARSPDGIGATKQSAPAGNGNPRFPEFNESWPPDVKIKWLEVYPQVGK